MRERRVPDGELLVDRGHQRRAEIRQFGKTSAIAREQIFEASAFGDFGVVFRAADNFLEPAKEQDFDAHGNHSIRNARHYSSGGGKSTTAKVSRPEAETLSEAASRARRTDSFQRSEEHTSELQSPCNLVCRLLLEKKKKQDAEPASSHRARIPSDACPCQTEPKRR